jgi:hypothetical protein
MIRNFGKPIALLSTCFTLVPSLSYSSTLKMETTCSSGTSVNFQRSALRGIPEDRTLRDINRLGLGTWRAHPNVTFSGMVYCLITRLRRYSIMSEDATQRTDDMWPVTSPVACDGKKTIGTWLQCTIARDRHFVRTLISFLTLLWAIYCRFGCVPRRDERKCRWYCLWWPILHK